jgi:hypothetical protein
MTNGAILLLQTTKIDSAVAKMTNAFRRRYARIIQCQKTDDCNNITIPHPRRRGLEEERLGMKRNRTPIRLNVFRVLSIWRETQRLIRGLHIDSDSHANAGLQNSDVICYSNSIFQVIASCTHLTEFFLSLPSEDHQCFRLYYKFANVIHSMITGRPDDVNPYNFVEIFKSNHKSANANECTYS